jgi:acetyl-CoA carboxylase beta subunit
VEGSTNIGFTGRRVVEQFRGREVSADFQCGTWLLRRRFVDECVAADRLTARLEELLKHAADGGRVADLQTRRSRKWIPKEVVVLDKIVCAPADVGGQSS